MRLTAVPENRDARWLLAQPHFSMPHPKTQQRLDMLTAQDEMVTS